jgi:hypothetical protein
MEGKAAEAREARRGMTAIGTKPTAPQARITTSDEAVEEDRVGDRVGVHGIVYRALLRTQHRRHTQTHSYIHHAHVHTFTYLQSVGSQKQAVARDT